MILTKIKDLLIKCIFSESATHKYALYLIRKSRCFCYEVELEALSCTLVVGLMKTQMMIRLRTVNFAEGVTQSA